MKREVGFVRARSGLGGQKVGTGSRMETCQGAGKSPTIVLLKKVQAAGTGEIVYG